MPTYEYLCKCGHEFEEYQSILSTPVAKCPECGKKAARQISAGVGLIFKGTGFYITDYKKKNGSFPKSEEASEKPKTEPPKEKPAATPAKSTTTE